MENSPQLPSSPLVYDYLDQFPEQAPAEVLAHYRELQKGVRGRVEESQIVYGAFQEAFMLMPADNSDDPNPVVKMYGHFLQSGDQEAIALALVSLPNFSQLYPESASELLGEYIGSTHLTTDEKIEALGIALLGGVELLTSVDGVASINAHRLRRNKV